MLQTTTCCHISKTSTEMGLQAQVFPPIQKKHVPDLLSKTEKQLQHQIEECGTLPRIRGLSLSLAVSSSPGWEPPSLKDMARISPWHSAQNTYPRRGERRPLWTENPGISVLCHTAMAVIAVIMTININSELICQLGHVFCFSLVESVSFFQV